ncbi:hypothetical protein RFI_37881, partial [Reticulomyxa filosa]
MFVIAFFFFLFLCLKRFNCLLTQLVFDRFWKHCPVEDSKFQQQTQQLSAKFPSFKEFYDAFLEKKSVELPKVSELGMAMVISEFKKINGA